MNIGQWEIKKNKLFIVFKVNISLNNNCKEKNYLLLSMMKKYHDI